MTLMNESGDTVPTVSFSKETARKLILEHEALYLKHCAEVGPHRQDKPEVIWSEYFIIEDAGALRVFCIRDAGHKLVGYALYFVRQDPHYASVKIAQCDMIYIEPGYRGGMGERFIEWIDQGLKNENVKAITQNTTVRYDFGSMLRRQGYEHVESIHIKRL